MKYVKLTLNEVADVLPQPILEDKREANEIMF
jgi:hypothetical protein